MRKKILISFLLFFFAVIAILACRTFWTLAHTYTPDFSVYYQAAENMLGATSVYTGKTTFTSFSYPLISAVFFTPFTFLSYQMAQTVFLVLNFFALIGIGWILPFLVLKKSSLMLSMCIFSFSYLSFPTKFTLGMGQVNLLAYFFLLVSIFFYRKKSTFGRRIFFCAMFFALACMLKPILGFMLLFFVLQKQWKIIFCTLVFFAGAFFLSTLLDHHAVADYFYYVQKVVPDVSRPVGKQIYYNQGFMSFIFREIASQQWRLLLSYIGMAGIFGGLVFCLIKTKNMLYQLACILSALPLLDTLSWQHHFVILIFPFFYCTYTVVLQKNWRGLSVVVLAYLLVSWNFVHPELLLHFPENILLSNTFYGAFILYIFLLLQRGKFRHSDKKLLPST